MTGTASASAPRRRGRGRPSRAEADSGPGARERILEAARAEFAQRGYDKTSVRGIAKAADVDAALVHHYFGTKDEVFEAAVEMTLEPVQPAPAVVGAGASLDGVGERMARYFIEVWENPATRAQLLALFRSALTHEAAAKVLRTFVLRRVLERVAADLDVPDPASARNWRRRTWWASRSCATSSRSNHWRPRTRRRSSGWWHRPCRDI